MKDFVAYHSAEVMGRAFAHDSSEPIVFLSNKSRRFLESSVGNRVWIVAGEKVQSRMRYEVVGLFSPAGITRAERHFEVAGPGTLLRPPVDVTGRDWMATMLKEQANFSLGLNTIQSAEVITQLESVFATSEPRAYGEEQPVDATFTEGAVTRVMVNRYERDPGARKACLAAHGRTCIVCAVDLATIYGPLATGIIHVHHRVPLSSVGSPSTVDPVRDLVPVCPNCHAVLHVAGSPSPEALRAILVAHRSPTPLGASADESLARS